MGLIWIATGMLAPRPRVGLALRCLVSALLMARNVAVVVGLVLDVPNIDVQPVDVFNTVLSVSLVSCTAWMITVTSARMRALVDSVLAAQPDPDLLAAAEKGCRRRGHAAGIFLLCTVLILTPAYAFPDTDRTRRNVWFALAIAFCGYGASALLGMSIFTCTTLMRLDMTFTRSALVKARARSLSIFCGITSLMAMVVCTGGLSYFLFALDSTASPFVLLNASVVILFYTVLSVDAFITLNVYVDSQTSTTSSTAYAVDWKSDHSPVRLVVQAISLAIGVSAIVLLWLAPWVIVAGPPSAVDEDETVPLWIGNAKAYKGGPARIFAVLVLAPLFSFPIPSAFCGMYDFSTWPSNMLNTAVPLFLLIAALQFLRTTWLLNFLVSMVSVVAQFRG